MNVNAILEKITKIFREKLEILAENENLNELTPESSLTIMRSIQNISSLIGIESLKMIFEENDIQENILMVGNELYRKKMKTEKKILTPIGELILQRNIYQKDSGGKTYIPLDNMLGIRGENMTHDVQEAILYSCAHNTPEETQKIIEKLCCYDVHASSIKRLIDKTVLEMEENHEELIEQVYQQEELPEKVDVFQSCFDGANILLDEPGKKKGRPKERPDDTSTQESKTCYKNAMCGSFTYYQINNESGIKKAERIESHYIAHMPEDYYPTFKARFEKEIEHHLKNVDINVPKIMLCDGHKAIWGYVNNTELYADFEKLIDYYHATEHLSKLAEWIFGKSSPEGQKWYDKMANILKTSQNGVEQLIKSAGYYIKTRKLSKSREEEANKELNYFKRNKTLMQYSRFIEKGWPIGSGIIEAACKSIVKQRMCRSGQRWSRKKGQHILTLRTLVKSNRWDEMWKIYKNFKCAA